MFNDNLGNNSNDDDMTKKLKIATMMTVVLAACRIISLDILMVISDLLTALMLYFFIHSKNQCMALLTGINGGVGIVYALIKIFSSWSLAKSNSSLYHVILVLIAIYALIVYSTILYLAYMGYNKYQTGLGFAPASSQQSNYNVSSNYGAIERGVGTNFAAFGGKGTTLG